MNKNGSLFLAFALSSAALPSIAQPILTTDIQLGETWGKLEIGNFKFKDEYQENGYSDTYETDITGQTIGLMTVQGSEEQQLVLGFQHFKMSNDESNASSTMISIGSKSTTDSGGALLAGLNYNLAGGDNSTDAFGGSIDFQPKPEGTGKTQFGLSFTMPQYESSSVTGGNTFGANIQKLQPLNDKVSFLLFTGVSITTDKEIESDYFDYTTSTGPQISFAGTLYFTPKPELTLSAGYSLSKYEEEYNFDGDKGTSDFTTSGFSFGATALF